MSWLDLPPSTAVATTRSVTERGLPIVEVSHECDEETGDILWQFHAGDGDFSPPNLLLVRLSRLLALDPSLATIAGLPVGHTATRRAVGEPWAIVLSPG